MVAGKTSNSSAYITSISLASINGFLLIWTLVILQKICTLRVPYWKVPWARPDMRAIIIELFVKLTLVIAHMIFVKFFNRL